MLVALAMATACTEPAGEAPEEAEAPPGAAWLLEGTEAERFARVARHLRGFDVAMVEVGYRYGELHFAGQDENWGYAAYQLDKIRTALDNGLERRPARAASARMIDAPLGAVRAAVEARDGAAFERAFDRLTEACNACHRAEDVAFVTVVRPRVRRSPVEARSEDDVGE